MKAMTIGRYVPYNTFIHKLDPRVKLWAMITFMVVIFFRFGSVYTNFFIYALIFFMILVLMRVAQLRLRQLLKQLQALWFMMLFLLIINILVPIESDITGSFMILGLQIYWSAIAQTLYIVFRIVLMLALTLMLTATTRPLDLTYALEWYLLPLKVLRFPTHEIAMTIAIALRFIPTLLDETLRIMKAQASRGVDFVHGKFKEKIRAVISLIVPLFISAFMRSEELANAMEARGYQPSQPRTRYRLLTWKHHDSSVLLFCLVLLAGLIALQTSGWDMQTWFQ
jgi:energy-coupling factor transport system permease protein